MLIKKLTLHSNDINKQFSFFQDTLGFNVEQNDNAISIKIGDATLEFINDTVDGKYHYCFLIPCNQIQEAQTWLSKRIDLIPDETDHYIVHSESWNAHSIYFYDGNGNIAELIARHDLQNESDKKFRSHSIISINEIGTPTGNISSLDSQLTKEIGSTFWKGNTIRFSTNGDQHGMFLLPNYKIKKTWFPTKVKLLPLPFMANVIQDRKEFNVRYENEKMDIVEVE